MAKMILRLAAPVCLLVVALALPSAASARDCGVYGTTNDGTTITVDAYRTTCSFGFRVASRFYAVQGVPKHLTVLGTRLTKGSHRSGSNWEFWNYYGTRNGRFADVFITETEDLPSAPTTTPPSTTPAPPVIPYPGSGYPVVCADGWISNSGGIQGACSHHGGVG